MIISVKLDNTAFVPMYPLYEGLKKPIYDAELLQNSNATVLSRKNHDFTIGHAYFMGKEYSIENTLNRKVIPLLLEYFMNDEKEVTVIIQMAGINIGGWPLKMKMHTINLFEYQNKATFPDEHIENLEVFLDDSWNKREKSNYYNEDEHREEVQHFLQILHKKTN